MLPTTVLAAILLTTANAHLFISSPVPIPGTNAKPPLDPSGSNFPCQGGTLPTTGGQPMAAGSKQTLAFDLGGGANTAVHGGGSCQMSITYETDPARQKDPKNWKVIYSIEGGCPSDARGNLDVAVPCTGRSTECVNSFPFTIPKGVKNGHAIMAWTWFNTIGNREMYMNCANVNFSGGDGSEVDSLPDLFVANLASVGSCPTVENFNVKFPNPGKYVTQHNQGNPYPLAVPTGPACSAPSGSDPGDSSPSCYAAPSSAPVYSAPAAPSAPAYSPPSMNTYSGGPASSAAPVDSSGSTGSAPGYLPPTTSVPSVPGSCIDGTVPCANPGSLICVDKYHFGLCDTDSCALPQPVAPGTMCEGGKIQKRKRVVKRGPHRQGIKKHGHMHGGMAM